MRRAIDYIPANRAMAQSPTLDALRTTVTLAFADRHRRRVRLFDDTGEGFLLDLPHAVRLGEGDCLRLVDGGVIVVRAAEEAVLTITCGGPTAAARIAWHIGNRHTPMQVLPDGRLRIVDDHVMRDMVEGLGGVVDAERAPFDPERGAYDGKSGHAHGHDHAVAGGETGSSDLQSTLAHYNHAGGNHAGGGHDHQDP